MIYSDRAQQERLFSAFAGPMITGILGPRRVGKSTLIEHYFSLHTDATVVRLNMDKMNQHC